MSPEHRLASAFEALDPALYAAEEPAVLRPLWEELARAFDALDLKYDGRADWPFATQVDYAWAAYYLDTAPEYVTTRVPPYERLERAADLALAHRLDAPGPPIELNLMLRMRELGRGEAAERRLLHALDVYGGAPYAKARMSVALGHLAVDTERHAEAQRWLEDADASMAAAPAGIPDAACEDLEADVETLRIAVLLDAGLPDQAVIAIARVHELLGTRLDQVTRERLLVLELAIDHVTDAIERVAERARAELARPAPDGLGVETRAIVTDYLGSALTTLSYANTERIADAIAVLEDLIEMPESAGSTRWISRVRLADLRRRAGQLERARGELDLARAEMQAAAPGSEPAQLLRDGAYFAVVESRIAIESGEPPERLRERLAKMERAFERLVDDWSAVPVRAAGIGILNYEIRRATLCELIRLELSVRGVQDGALRAFAHVMRIEALGTLARSLAAEAGGEAPTLEDVRTVLCGERRGVLLIVPGPERSYVLALDRDDVRCVEVGAWRAWRALQGDFVAALSRSPRATSDPERRRAEIARLGTLLAEVWLPPGVRECVERWEELSIVGSEWIGFVPFGALPFRGSELGRERALASLPSLTVACLLERRATARGRAGERRGLAVLGAPTADARSPEWSAQHERALREAWGGERFECRTAGAATFAALRELCDRRPAALEILAHGYYDTTKLPPAGIQLAPSAGDDGRVTAPRLASLSLPPFVALAVCGAWLGPRRTGDDGANHLGGACLGAGADAVLMSGAEIDQYSTERLLEVLSQLMLRDGLPPARALLEARRTLARDPRTADPFDQALVQVSGLGFRPLAGTRPSAAPSSRTWIWLVAGLALLGLAWSAWRRRA